MPANRPLNEILKDTGVTGFKEPYPDELYADVPAGLFKAACLKLHKELRSPVMMFFACDERARDNSFFIYCAFLSSQHKKWVFVKTQLPGDSASFPSLSWEMHSAGLFEREIKEMFGLEPAGGLDTRSLRLHEETWPAGNFPLRKDFKFSASNSGPRGNYPFMKVEGEGVFEVPVGPVHAGIIGPGHFRFSAAGEPVINLEIRLGFTHRGVEKLFEGKDYAEGTSLSECVCGDTAFAYSRAYCSAIEKIFRVNAGKSHFYMRSIFLELERLYNHVSSIGGMATDTGFSAPAALAQVIKENLLQLNKRLTQSRYLKGVNAPGGITGGSCAESIVAAGPALEAIRGDINSLEEILENSVSFMDRLDGTGTLNKKVAEDFGITGLAGRSSGVPLDLRSIFPGDCGNLNFHPLRSDVGDVRARLEIRLEEISGSFDIIRHFTGLLAREAPCGRAEIKPAKGEALGYAEGWRGPVLFWVKTGEKGIIERCKIVDASFLNWAGLAYSVPGNIIPDFPLCNKSFDLSYPGGDL